MKLTVVIPVFNERETLAPLVDGILGHTGGHECRILFVDDGSTDGSFEAARSLHDRYPQVDVIRLRKNFGKSAALAAGFARVEGGVVITMDGDLQDDPKEIPGLLAKLDEGFDVVCGWKKIRHDPWHKTFPSRIYNGAVCRLFNVNLHDVNCGYKAFRTEVVKNLRIYGDMHRLVAVMAANLGYRVTEIPVEHHARRFGVSKYGLARFSRGAADVLTARFLCRYRFCPGHFFTRWAVVAALLTFIGAATAVAFWAVLGRHLLGLAFLILTAALFVAAGVALCASLLAELIVYHHGPDRPDSFVAEELLHGPPGCHG